MPASAPSQQPKRSLTLWLAVLYGLGMAIGAGIYVLDGIAAGRSGMNVPLAFVMAALVMSFSAALFAEVGTRMPVRASEAAHFEKAFNRPWLSLTLRLLVVLAATISAAMISVGCAGYLGVFLDRPAPWISTLVVLSMGLVACLSTRQGNLPEVLTHLNRRTRTPLFATGIDVAAILAMVIVVPLAGLADLTARFTLAVFAIINIALIRIKSREAAPPLYVFVCRQWVPVAGLVSSIGLLLLDLVVQ